jgi:hypothetical protein
LYRKLRVPHSRPGVNNLNATEYELLMGFCGFDDIPSLIIWQWLQLIRK